MVKVFACIVCLSLAFACEPGEKKNHAVSREPVSVIIPDAPEPIADSIYAEFPGALPAHIFADSILTYLSEKYGITSDQIPMGASTCVDDIIYTKNFHAHPEIKGPFNLGGLAGLPFGGISGLSAFAHHIPENGTMLLVIAPHIGYTKNNGWGYVLRSGQPEPSTCCGALMGTMLKLEKGGLKQTKPIAIDYQGILINNMAVQREQEIVGHHNPIAVLTRLTNQEAEKQIMEQVNSMEIKHVNYIVSMSGILINTDYPYTDYLWLNHLAVYDAKNKTFLGERKN
jgi:hypothetical protein